MSGPSPTRRGASVALAILGLSGLGGTVATGAGAATASRVVSPRSRATRSRETCPKVGGKPERVARSAASRRRAAEHAQAQPNCAPVHPAVEARAGVRKLPLWPRHVEIRISGDRCFIQRSRDGAHYFNCWPAQHAAHPGGSAPTRAGSGTTTSGGAGLAGASTTGKGGTASGGTGSTTAGSGDTGSTTSGGGTGTPTSGGTGAPGGTTTGTGTTATGGTGSTSGDSGATATPTGTGTGTTTSGGAGGTASSGGTATGGTATGGTGGTATGGTATGGTGATTAGSGGTGTTGGTTTGGTAAAVVPLGMGGTWSKLIFDDEFANDSSLNSRLWTPYWFSNGSSSNSTVMDSANVTVSGGDLNLALASNRTGGLVSTNGKFSYTYGYAEARIYLPPSGSTIANWPAFWTDGQSWPADGEQDVMEGLGGSACYHFHSKPAAPVGAPRATSPAGTPTALIGSRAR